MEVTKVTKQKVGTTISRPDGTAFGVTSGTYQVYASTDTAKATVLASGNLTISSAEVDANDKDCWALIDFTAATYVAGRSYTFRALVVIAGTGEEEPHDQTIDVTA